MKQGKFITLEGIDGAGKSTQLAWIVELLQRAGLQAVVTREPGGTELFTNRIDPAAHPYYQALQGLKVSAHFFIRRDGALIQFVPCNQRAWHAGVSNWQGRERCNDFSIGIELEGSDTTPFTDAQYEVLIGLTQCLCEHYPIQNIAGHSDIASGRKTDPGPWFDWKRYDSSLNSGLINRPANNTPS